MISLTSIRLTPDARPLVQGVSNCVNIIGIWCSDRRLFVNKDMGRLIR